MNLLFIRQLSPWALGDSAYPSDKNKFPQRPFTIQFVGKNMREANSVTPFQPPGPEAMRCDASAMVLYANQDPRPQ